MKVINSKKISGSFKVTASFDSVTIDLAFVPEIIKVSFKDAKKKKPSAENPDFVEWSLNIVDSSHSQLIISYNASEERVIKYAAFVPQNDPEQMYFS